MQNESPDTITVSEEEYMMFRAQLYSLEKKLEKAILLLEAYGIELG